MHVHVYVCDACLPISDVHALYIYVPVRVCVGSTRERGHADDTYSVCVCVCVVRCFL